MKKKTPNDFYFESIFNLYVLEFGNLLTLEKWKEWVDYRLEIKHKLTKSTAERQMIFLSKQPDPAKCIDESITNGWQGLFAQKNNGKKLGNDNGGYTYEEAINQNGGKFGGWIKQEDGLWYKN
ncbi:MAG: hypothetical protein IPJ03_17765 [Ignavibacteriales bacterium]|nr:hypothetical protein [Ignavibacteriales bacterium]